MGYVCQGPSTVRVLPAGAGDWGKLGYEANDAVTVAVVQTQDGWSQPAGA